VLRPARNTKRRFVRQTRRTQMKYSKMLALAVVAVGALIALAGTASATVLCKTTSTPCGEKWHSGTIAFLHSGESVTISETGGKVLATCTEGALKYTTQSEGSSAETVVAELEGPNFFGGCTKQPYLLARGVIEIHHIAGTDNGTVTAKGLDLTLEVLTMLGQYVSCTYTSGESIDFGTLKGAETPELEVNATFSKKEGSFLCPGDVVWRGRYGIELGSIYVEPE
jgi:hypothetical protein